MADWPKTAKLWPNQVNPTWLNRFFQSAEEILSEFSDTIQSDDYFPNSQFVLIIHSVGISIVTGISFARVSSSKRITILNTLQREDWFVVYSHPRKEEQAQFHLNFKGVETFFPRLRVPAARENTSRILPLFPNYLFVRIHVPTECYLVGWTPGVKRLVSFGDEPIPIDKGVVCFLQQLADADGVIQAHTKIRCGQEVEISGGPFDGLTGIIQAPPDNKGRVRVLLKLLSRQISVKFGVEFIKGGRAAWAPATPGNIGPGLFSAES